MTGAIGRVMWAVLLAVVGLWSWREAARAESAAEAWRDLAGLAAGVHAPPSPSAASTWLPAAWRGDDAGAAHRRHARLLAAPLRRPRPQPRRRP